MIHIYSQKINYGLFKCGGGKTRLSQLLRQHSRSNLFTKFRLTNFYILNLQIGRILPFGNQS